MSEESLMEYAELINKAEENVERMHSEEQEKKKKKQKEDGITYTLPTVNRFGILREEGNVCLGETSKEVEEQKKGSRMKRR